MRARDRRALILVDHGSRREEANATLRCMARLVQHLAGDETLVTHAHMELAHPTIAEAYATAVAWGATRIAVMPYMLAPGRHASEDIPRMVAEAAAAFPSVTYQVTSPLGVHARLAEVVLDRCQHPLKRALPSAVTCPLGTDHTRSVAAGGAASDCGEPWCPDKEDESG